MANRDMMRCSSLLIIGEMQIKITMRYHLTRSEWSSSKSLQIKKCWRRCVNWCSHYGEQNGFLKKLKNRTTIWSSNLTPGQTIIWECIYTPMFTAALFRIARTWKQPKCPLTDDLIKMWYIYAMEYYLTIKK